MLRAALVRLVLPLLAVGVLGTLPALATSARLVPEAAAVVPVPEVSLPGAWTERGHSGALKVLVAEPGAPLDGALGVSALERARVHYRWASRAEARGGEAPALSTGLRAPERPGVWTLQLATAGGRQTALQLIAPVPFDGRRTRLNGYHIGRWPPGADRLGEAYTPPERLIEVTRENQDTWVSEHFQLRHFLTKDQAHVWPKYLVLDLALVDKLELVIQELQAQGFARKGLHVMSGFRTPQYNGPGRNGRAKYSRHTYGDAADVWVDDDGDGRMDDLDGDGDVDVRDAEVLAQAVDRVEARVPALVGGYGVYKANRAHGPFVHVDVRGTPARWAKR